MSNSVTVDLLGSNEGLNQTLDESESLVMAFGAQVVDSISAAFESFGGEPAWASSILDALTDLNSGLDRLTSTVEEANDNAVDAFDQLTTSVVEVSDAVETMSDSVVDGFENLADEARDTNREIGRLADGVEDGFDDIEHAIHDTTDAVDDLADETHEIRKGFRNSERSVSHFADHTEKELRDTQKNVKGFGGALKNVFKGLVKGAAMGAGFGIAVKGVDLLTGSIGKLATGVFQLTELYGEQERQEKKLDSVLKATGNAAGFTLAQMKELASGMQDVTTFGDETVLGAQAIIATFKNVRGDHFKEATMLAADMATVLDGDLKSSAMQVAKALNDPVVGVSALAEAGVSFTQSQKDTIKSLVEMGDVAGAQKIILAELRGEFGGAASDAADTFAGKAQRLKNRLGDIGETIGGAVIPLLEELVPYVELVATGIENAVPIIKTAVGTFFQMSDASGWLRESLEWLAESGLMAFSLIESAIKNYDTTLQLSWASTKLSIVRMVEQYKWAFTEVIPELLRWFFDNWYEIFTDIGNFTSTVVTNMQENLKNFFMGIFSFLQGDKVDFKWKGLTEGFEATLKELPQIAEREKGNLEKALEMDVNRLAMKSANQFNDTLAKNRKLLDDMFTEREREPIDLTDTASDEYEAPEPEEKEDDKDEKKDDKDEKKDEGSASGFEDLVALNKRIAASAAGTDPVEDAVKGIGGDIVDAVGEVAENLVDFGADFVDAMGDTELGKEVKDWTNAVVDGIESIIPDFDTDSITDSLSAFVPDFDFSGITDTLSGFGIEMPEPTLDTNTKPTNDGTETIELMNQENLTAGKLDTLIGIVQAVGSKLPLVGAYGR